MPAYAHLYVEIQSHSRHSEQQLLISITPQLRLIFHALYPRLLQHFGRRSGLLLIETCNFAEVDLLVEKVLKGRCNVIVVVVSAVGMRVVVRIFAVVVVVGVGV